MIVRAVFGGVARVVLRTGRLERLMRIMMARMRGVIIGTGKQLSWKVVRADLQPESAVARRHETGGNERPNRKCNQQEACEPRVSA